jgi:hypothetical protein
VSLRVITVCQVVCAVACGTAREPATAHDAASRAIAPDAGLTRRDAAAPRPPPIDRAAVEALVAAWLDAQNQGDFAAYGALYAPGFRGVRRSGKQTVRLDRDGWLADRETMFARPMTVAARDVEIRLAPVGARIGLTQEWSSGTYTDVGPKEIVAVVTPDGLRILREEMLQSRMSRPPTLGDAPLLVVERGLVILSDQAELAWAARDAEPELLDGAVPDDADPDRRGSFAAQRAVDEAALPARLRRWKGQALRLGGGASCTATIDGFVLLAEAELGADEATARGAGERDVAGVVLDAPGRVLAATVRDGCRASWALPASARAPAAWRISEAPADVVARLPFVDDGARTSLIEPPAGGDGALVFHAYVSCNGDDGAHLYRRRDMQELHAGGHASLEAAIDVDADGFPELVVDGGWLAWDADDHAYSRYQMIESPLPPCGE